MKFEKTQTYQNLARAFAGECQAGMRYQMVAKLAMDEGLKTLSDKIRAIAKNETVHATQFFQQFLGLGGNKEDVQIDAGYPFHSGTLAEGLKFSEGDEKSEATKIYPNFADIAKEEEFLDVERLFRQIAEVEHHHEAIFRYLANAVKNGTLYQNDSPVLWVCSECGYQHVSTQAWKTCPLCKAKQGYVELHLPFEGVTK